MLDPILSLLKFISRNELVALTVIVGAALLIMYDSGNVDSVAIVVLVGIYVFGLIFISALDM